MQVSAFCEPFRSRGEESTSAAEKKESSEVIVVASSSRRLRTLSTWGKIRVPSLSVKNSRNNVIVGVEISQVMKQMTNCWQKTSTQDLSIFFLVWATYESLIRPVPKSANTLSVGMLLPKSSCRWYALCSSDSSFSANILLRLSTYIPSKRKQLNSLCTRYNTSQRATSKQY